MTFDLSRMFRPKSIAVIGGGAWCEQVIKQLRLMEFQGEIWPVHPSAQQFCGLPTFPAVDVLPSAPDAAFIGINREKTIPSVAALSKRGAGGAVCFASGFSEAAAEDANGDTLQAQLISAAGNMPILGPNCYGFINALDGSLLWPDQHGCTRVDNGVAILTQSSNIAINLTMQKRALPIAYMVTCGNMAQINQAQIALALLDDPRVTAIGLHIEGFKNLRDWEALAHKAYQKGIPLVALKVGVSEQAQQATISHTASLAGSDAGAQAFLDRLGIPRVNALPDLLETLKLLHCYGPLSSKNIASISCSGGEASLIADMAIDSDLRFPPLSEAQKSRLRDALGSMVSLNNPLDYHTFIWRDQSKMAQAWAAMTDENTSITLSIVDYPTTDASDWTHATNAALQVRAETGANFAIAATLPELMPLNTAETLLEGGVVPFMGLRETLAACEAAASQGEPAQEPVCLPNAVPTSKTLNEAVAKTALAQHGLEIPRHITASNKTQIIHAADQLRPPFAIKGIGVAHKSDQNAVRLGISREDAVQAAFEIGTDEVLIEEMVMDCVVELLIGVVRDPAHGFVLTLGAGGVLTEVLSDTVSLLLPTNREDIRRSLAKLKIAPILAGYRGKPSVDMDKLVAAILAVQAYVIANADTVSEVEINPLLCTPDRAVAVDALIRKA